MACRDEGPLDRYSRGTFGCHLCSYCTGFANIKENPQILDEAKRLNQLGLRSKDALHIACAISSECNYFLTTDDQILNKSKSVENLVITDPISFIKEVYL